MKIVFSGIQGCGKGTQARLLVEKYGFKLIEMGNEFRKIVKSETKLGNKVKKIIDSGAQVDSKTGGEIMIEAINNNKNKKIIYDGFIRNSWNKDIFDKIVPEYKVIFFDLPVKKAKKRILGRMFDSDSGETFSYQTKVNPKTGKILIKRNDDKNEKAILKRISEFEKNTIPIIKIQKKEGKVLSINADQNIKNVFKELINKLKLD